MKQFLLFLSFVLTTFLSAGNIYYVKQGGVGNGASWAQASGDLQNVINGAASGDTVFVAQGTYYPEYAVGGSTDPRDKSFILKDNVSVVGGFEGVDESERSQPYNFPTILSGDIGVLSDQDDNSYHVVYIQSSLQHKEFYLEGFTITNGNATSSDSTAIRSGAGIYINVGLGTTVTIINNKMSDNVALDSGGAIYCKNSNIANIRIDNNFIYNNWALKGAGGGITLASQANVTVQGNTIVRNSAPKGAGVALTSESGTIYIYNNIMWDNVTAGSDLFSHPSNNLKIMNNLFTIEQEFIKLDESNIFGQYPIFANPNVSDYSILKGSPAVNGGNNEYVPKAVKKDLNGEPRIVKTVDMGAYEYQAVDDIDARMQKVGVNGVLAALIDMSNYAATVEYSQRPWNISVQPLSEVATFRVLAEDKVTVVDITNIDLKLGNENYFWIEIIPEEGEAFKDVYKLTVNMIPKPLIIAGMTIKDKSWDDTLIGEVGEPGLLAGVVNNDTVYVDYTDVVVLFDSKDSAMEIPVTITGLALHGNDSLNYTLVTPNDLKGNILSGDASLIDLIIDGVSHDINKIYDLKCQDINTINVEVVIDEFATVISDDVTIVDRKFEVVTDRPMYKEVKFTVTSQDGKSVKVYILKIERRIPFDDVVKTKWNNTFVIDMVATKTMGFSPKAYQWFKNDAPLSNETRSYLAAGPKETDHFEEGVFYNVALTFEDGSVVNTCAKKFVKTSRRAFSVYPNPVLKGQALYLQTGDELSTSNEGRIDVYDMSGNPVGSVNSQPHITELPVINTPGTYVVKFSGKDGSNKSSIIIVK